MMAGLSDVEAVQKAEGLVEQQGRIVERLKKWRAEEFKRKSKLTDIRVEFGKTEVYSVAASSPWVSNHRHGVILDISNSSRRGPG